MQQNATNRRSRWWSAAAAWAVGSLVVVRVSVGVGVRVRVRVRVP